MHKRSKPGLKGMHIHDLSPELVRRIHLVKAATGKNVNDIVIFALQRLVNDIAKLPKSSTDLHAFLQQSMEVPLELDRQIEEKEEREEREAEDAREGKGGVG